MGIEQIIKENSREHLYDYYRSLGYDHKVSASLALFTYGDYRYRDLSIDDLYEALCRGEEYLPPEVQEERRQWEREQRQWEREQKRREKARRQSRMQRLASRSTMAFDAVDDLSCMKKSVSTIPEGASLCCAPDASYAPQASILSGAASFAPSATGAASYASSANLAPTAAGFPLGSDFATDEYEPVEEKGPRTVSTEQTSTFRMTMNTASAGVVLNQLRNGRRIDRSMVRIEEMLNYFRYNAVLPTDKMFNISSEIMDAGSAQDAGGAHKYLYINVQGREEVKDRQNIIILLDVSGSMNSNREHTQAIIATIISKLGNGDKLSLITYSSDDRVELEAFTVNGPEDRIRALEKLLSINIYGYTDGSKGIERAYKIGKKNYIDGGNNQVILITDGDLNFGITDKGGLEELIEKKKKNHLFLSVIGTGLLNYKDDKLETLSKHGNGVYRVVNNLADVRKSIDEEYSSLVNIIAKDVKAQVEFNPEVVESYRLLGFENREISREDFTNDAVISEPFGSGGYGVALYELKMRATNAPAPVESSLKYSKLVTTGSRELATVKVRYKEPLEDRSHELAKVIGSAKAGHTDDLRLAYIVYVCAEKLRGSDKISDEEIELAKRLYQELGDQARERNSADLYKLAGILDKSEKELGIGIQEDDPFEW